MLRRGRPVSLGRRPGIRQGSGFVPRLGLHPPHHLRPQNRRSQGRRRADRARPQGGRGDHPRRRPAVRDSAGTENVPGIVGWAWPPVWPLQNSRPWRCDSASCATSWSGVWSRSYRMRSSTVGRAHAHPHHERIDPGTDSEALLMHLDLAASPARPAPRAALGRSSRRTC